MSDVIVEGRWVLTSRGLPHWLLVTEQYSLHAAREADGLRVRVADADLLKARVISRDHFALASGVVAMLPSFCGLGLGRYSLSVRNCQTAFRAWLMKFNKAYKASIKEPTEE